MQQKKKSHWPNLGNHDSTNPMNFVASKKGFGAMLPFLGLCFLFLLLCIVCLVIALVFKDKGSGDMTYQSSLNSAAIFLDFAQLQTSTGSMYQKLNTNYFFSATKQPERVFFETIMETVSAGCYRTDWYTSVDGKSYQLSTKLGGTNDMTQKCPNEGFSSIIMIPNYHIYLSMPNSLKSTIAGVKVNGRLQ